MIRDALQQIVTAAVDQLVQSNQLPEAVRSVRIEITDTKQPEHGDFACNYALTASKAAGMNPRQLGEILAEGIREVGKEEIDAIELAGPGFINFRLNPGWVASFVPQVLKLGEALPNAQNPTSIAQKINVEFVSVNPNGPITIGSGRGAAYGSTLCNVLEAAGNKVHREYYINDGVNSEQMRLFAESVRHFYEKVDVEKHGPSTDGKEWFPFPERGYKGDYVEQAARDMHAKVDPGNCFDDVAQWPVPQFQSVVQDIMLAAQKSALETFSTTFDTWFSEQSLHDSGVVAEEMVQMAASQVADDREIRTVLKLAKGGKIDDVILEDQAGKAEVEDDVHGEGGKEGEEGQEASPQSTDHSPQATSKTLWLRSAKFGDDMDRVLKRRDGRLTYIASDVAYHKDKLLDLSGVRGTGPVDKMITVLGPDHHGYIGRLQAVVAAMLKAEGIVNRESSIAESDVPLTDLDAKIYASAEERDLCKAALAEAKQKLEVQIFQLVRFVKDGKPAPMRKRDGNIYALIDLMKEIGENVKPNGSEEEKLEAGKDVARFFYLMRSHDTTFDFDLDLAQKQSDENPVFYVQYAHARICSVIAKAAGTEGIKDLGKEEMEHSLLTHERELTLIRKICDLPYEVQRSAEDYGVHRLATYAIELARTYHHFYDVCRVIQSDQPELTRARLALCEATRIALKGTLDLLGISAPDRMERAEPQAV